MTIPLAVTQFFRQRGLALAVLGILAVYGLEAHARRRLMSTPASLGDQGAYLAYAQQMHDSSYTVVGERNRMPVYPFLLSLIYRPGLSETQFLRRAQAFNVNLSIVLLLLLFLIFRKFFSAFYAVGLLAVSAFGVFLYRAVNAQTELLYYFLSFCAFVLLLQMLIAPRWWLAALSGAAVGVAHLTKASALPAFGVWIVVFIAQGFWRYRVPVTTALSRCKTPLPGDLAPWRHGQRLGLLLLVIGTFLSVIFPYVRTSKQIHGSYFYNVNSTFVMWCDSSLEGWQFLKAYGDEETRRSLRADQIPSPVKYWREHSIAQIAHRLVHGLSDLSTQNARAIGYYKFVVLFALTAGVLRIRQPRRALQLISGKPFATAFCLLFFLVYLLLYAWYDLIVSDTRFILSIFLPFVFAASIFVLGMGKDRTVAIAGWRLPFARWLSCLLICLALIDAIYNASRSLR